MRIFQAVTDLGPVLKQQSQVPADDGQLQHSEIINSELFKPRADSSELFKPAHALLYHVSSAITLVVKFGGRIVPGLFILFVRNYRFNILPA